MQTPGTTSFVNFPITSSQIEGETKIFTFRDLGLHPISSCGMRVNTLGPFDLDFPFPLPLPLEYGEGPPRDPPPFTFSYVDSLLENCLG